jgi:rhamnulokinase
MIDQAVPRFHAAVDLGASSGRVMLGRWADGRLALTEVHRRPSWVWRAPE